MSDRQTVQQTRFPVLCQTVPNSHDDCLLHLLQEPLKPEGVKGRRMVHEREVWSKSFPKDSIPSPSPQSPSHRVGPWRVGRSVQR